MGAACHSTGLKMCFMCLLLGFSICCWTCSIWKGVDSARGGGGVNCIYFRDTGCGPNSAQLHSHSCSMAHPAWPCSLTFLVRVPLAPLRGSFQARGAACYSGRRPCTLVLKRRQAVFTPSCWAEPACCCSICGIMLTVACTASAGCLGTGCRPSKRGSERRTMCRRWRNGTSCR